MIDTLKTQKSNQTREYMRNLLVFLSKFTVLYGISNLVDILESAQAGLTTILLFDNFEYVFDIDGYKLKKIVAYNYCMLINHLCSQLNDFMLDNLMHKIIQLYYKIYKISAYYNLGDNQLGLTDNFVYESKTSNNLVNAAITNEFKQYSLIYQMNENKLLLHIVETINTNYHKNVIVQIIPLLDEKEKDFISNLISNNKN